MVSWSNHRNVFVITLEEGPVFIEVTGTFWYIGSGLFVCKATVVGILFGFALSLEHSVKRAYSQSRFPLYVVMQDKALWCWKKRATER